jgi:hypothetical protein
MRPGDFRGPRPSNHTEGPTLEEEDVNEPPIDLERLGALMEGTVHPRERAALLARLAASEAELESYADALALRDELAAEDGAAPAPAETPVLPLRTRRTRGWGGPARLALAASVAAVAIGGAVWGLSKGAGDDDPGRYAALLGRPGLPAGWNAEPWTASRTPDEVLDPHARAVRIGARITALETAAAARDSAAVRRAAAGVGALLDPLPAAGPAASLYAELGRRAGEPAAATRALRERGRRTAARLAGEDGVALGAWAEAARLAAARRDQGFFRSDATHRALDRAARDSRLTPTARAGVERVRAGLAASPAPDWAVLERGATRILSDAGR